MGKSTAQLFNLFIIFTNILLSTACQTIETVKERGPGAEREVEEAQMAIVLNYLNTSEPNKAHAELRNLLQSHPDSHELINLMGLTQLALGNAKTASSYFRKAYGIDDNTAYGLNLSSSLIEERKYVAAINVLNKLKKAVAEYQYPERIFHNLGLAWEKRRKPKTAIKYYDQALSHNPNNYITLMQLGKLYERQQMDTQAINRYTEAASRCQACFEPRKYLAFLLIKTGQAKRAQEIINEFSRKPEVAAADRQQAALLAKKLASASEVIIH